MTRVRRFENFTVIDLWQSVPDACPRCGIECCHATDNGDGDLICAGHCDANGQHVADEDES